MKTRYYVVEKETGRNVGAKEGYHSWRAARQAQMNIKDIQTEVKDAVHETSIRS